MEGFQAEKVRDAMIREIQRIRDSEGWSDVVIGISGGKDSSIAAALCARALGAKHVYGVMLPDGCQSDIEDSRTIVRSLGIHGRTVDISSMHTALMGSIHLPDGGDCGDPTSFSVEYKKESEINMLPRIRMTVLRYIGQCLGARLCGTGNLSESTVGYCTKDGDTSCDFNVLGALTSLEVVEIGLTMKELPEGLVRKVPSDGLSGISDEEKLGVSYLQIHNYIRNSGNTGDPEADRKIKAMERASGHKRKMPGKILCNEEGQLLESYWNSFGILPNSKPLC